MSVYLITEGCCHIYRSVRSNGGRACLSGLRLVFRITTLTGLQRAHWPRGGNGEALTSPPHGPWWFPSLYCFVLGEKSCLMVLQVCWDQHVENCIRSTWRAQEGLVQWCWRIFPDFSCFLLVNQKEEGDCFAVLCWHSELTKLCLAWNGSG